MEREIKFKAGWDLENVVYVLLAAKENGDCVYCNFNGHILHSDSVSMDSAYIEVCGCTKAEFNKKIQEEYDKYIYHEQKYREELEMIKQNMKDLEQQSKDNIPFWIERGKSLIFPQKYKEWENCVCDCAIKGKYCMYLNTVLEIMEELDKGATLEQAKKILDNQNYDAVVENTVRSIVFDFSKRGPEFWEATEKRAIFPPYQKIIDEKKQENIKLAKENSESNEIRKNI